MNKIIDNILRFGEGVSFLISNFETTWPILKIQSTKFDNISPGLTQYPLLSANQLKVSIPTAVVKL